MEDLRFETADEDYECNASLFIKDCLDDIQDELIAEQKQAIEKAKANNWHVLKGERCRMYTWDKGSDEEMECVEIPEMAEICTKLKLWPE